MWGDAKIDEFHLTIFGEKYVVTFDVTVHASVRVQMREGAHGPAQNVRQLWFSEAASASS